MEAQRIFPPKGYFSASHGVRGAGGGGRLLWSGSQGCGHNNPPHPAASADLLPVRSACPSCFETRVWPGADSLPRAHGVPCFPHNKPCGGRPSRRPGTGGNFQISQESCCSDFNRALSSHFDSPTVGGGRGACRRGSWAALGALRSLVGSRGSGASSAPGGGTSMFLALA